MLDRPKMSQVLLKLIGNAIKFSPNGANIQITVDQEPTKVRISVRDNGPGIPADELCSIFIPFYRSQRPASIQRGIRSGARDLQANCGAPRRQYMGGECNRRRYGLSADAPAQCPGGAHPVNPAGADSGAANSDRTTTDLYRKRPGTTLLSRQRLPRRLERLRRRQRNLISSSS